MASGNTLYQFDPLSIRPPGTLAAPIDFLLGTSSPAEGHPVLKFDATTIWYADFRFKLPAHYAGGGLTLELISGAATTTGGVVWEAAIRRIQDDAEDIDTTAHTYDYNLVAVTTLANVVGETTHDNITFTSGADMDSIAVGEWGILRLRRKCDHASDTAAADAYMHFMELRET